MTKPTNTDIFISREPRFEVRYTSGKTIYSEGLIDHRWVSRYWSASGHVNFSYEVWNDDAFELAIDGNQLPADWQLAGAKEIPAERAGQRHFTVELAHATQPVRVAVHTVLDGTPVLTRWLEVTNTSPKPFALTAVRPWTTRLWGVWREVKDATLPVGEDAFSLGYFTADTQFSEGRFEWHPVKIGNTRFASREVQSFNAPFFIARNATCGEYFIGQLEWSGMWEIDFRCSEVGGKEVGLWLKAGPWSSAAQRVIAPGETVTTPALHLGNIEGDFDAVVQGMHDHLRRSVCPPRKPEHSFLVQYSAVGDGGYLASKRAQPRGLSEEKVLKQIDLADALGAELFIIDAGWWDKPGDWVFPADRFPRGGRFLADAAHKKGMLYGLYVEIERTLAWNSGDDGLTSNFATRHPDWFFRPWGILDLTNPEVAAYMEAELVRIIEENQLDLYRLDYNPFDVGELAVKERDGYLENVVWRQYEAFYAICDRIRAQYPNLILQQCAAGGGRNDLGFVRRYHENYLTDGLWLPRLARVYAGQSLSLTPENFIIGAGMPYPFYRRQTMGHLDTHLRIMFTLSTPWLLSEAAPNLDELLPERLAAYRRYADLYKSFIRPLLPTCRLFQHAPITAKSDVNAGGWFAVEFAAPDRAKGWATIIRIGDDPSDVFTLKPRGLDPGKRYRVTFDNLRSTAVVSGFELMQRGLDIRLEAINSSELLLFEAE